MKNGQQRLRGATIGAGYFSQIQMEAWQRVEGAVITAICDLDRNKAEGMQAMYNIPTSYTDVYQMLDTEKPDFVDIVTRPETRLALVRAAAERSVHVLCQKPLAPTYVDGVALVELSRTLGVRLMVNENWRWQPWYREIRKLLANDTIGEPFYARFTIRRGDGRGENPFVNQPYFRDMPRFLLHETIVHFIDTARYLWGEISTVSSWHKRIHPDIAGEDFTLTTLGMANGMTVFIDANRYTSPILAGPARTFGTLHIEGRTGQIQLQNDGSIHVYPIDKPDHVYAYEIPTVGYFGDCCRATQQHFIDSLRDSTPCETEGESYLKTFRAVFAGYESAQSGKSVRLDG